MNLLPYHYQFNPTESVWAQTECDMADKNSTLRFSDVEILTNTSLDDSIETVS
jgi:hypothetical protein